MMRFIPTHLTNSGLREAAKRINLELADYATPARLASSNQRQPVPRLVQINMDVGTGRLLYACGSFRLERLVDGEA